MSVTDALTDLRMAAERVREAQDIAGHRPLEYRLALKDAMTYIERAREVLLSTGRWP